MPTLKNAPRSHEFIASFDKWGRAELAARVIGRVYDDLNRKMAVRGRKVLMNRDHFHALDGAVRKYLSDFWQRPLATSVAFEQDSVDPSRIVATAWIVDDESFENLKRFKEAYNREREKREREYRELVEETIEKFANDLLIMDDVSPEFRRLVSSALSTHATELTSPYARALSEMLREDS